MKKKFDVSKFESLESNGDVLKGGFSVAFTTTTKSSLGGNNCYGGNCSPGCGTSIKPDFS